MFRAYKISLEKSVLIEIKQNANYWECNYWVNAKKSPLNQSILLNFTEKKHISTYYMCNIIITNVHYRVERVITCQHPI